MTVHKYHIVDMYCQHRSKLYQQIISPCAGGGAGVTRLWAYSVSIVMSEH